MARSLIGRQWFEFSNEKKGDVMNRSTRLLTHKLVHQFAPGDYGRLRQLSIRASEFGYDPFGLELETAMLSFLLFKFLLYRNWFRVESRGVENIPLEAPVLITPNHSGAILLDGAMLGVDLAEKMARPRIMRGVVDNFAGSLPFVNTFFARCG